MKKINSVQLQEHGLMEEVFWKILHKNHVSIQADFSGNLFVEIDHGSFKQQSPLNICEPKLKNIPTFGGDEDD